MASNSGSTGKSAAVPQKIVVWEWEDDFGHGVPYGPLECNAIENAISTGRMNVRLGNANPSFHDYEIDLSLRKQRNMRTGMERNIYRKMLHPSHSLANNCTWQWNKALHKNHPPRWTSYSTDMIDYIEQMYLTNRKCSFDFPLSFRMDHCIDLKKKLQINKRTKYEREIQRVNLPCPYPAHTAIVQPTINPLAANARPSPYQPPLGGPLNVGNIQNGHFMTTHQASFQNPQNVASISVTPSAPPSTGKGRPLPPNPVKKGSAGTHNKSSHTKSGGVNARSQNSATANGVLQSNAQSGALGTTTSSTGDGNAVKKKKTQKSVKLPPCPAGGIPCSSGNNTSTVPVDKVIKSFMKTMKVDPKSKDDCAICQSALTDASGFGKSKETLELNLCKHVFHKECIEASYSHGVQNGCFVCPACNKMHGIKTGTQPPGIMTYLTLPNSLPGYTGYKTLRVIYDIRPGVQTAEHPHPGKPFSTHGFPRVGYLPDNNEGRRVLLLLIEAWKRRLIFTVGQSSTTGLEDCVTWTGIHHKTETKSRRGHGYPDEGYLDRVMLELAAEGVVEEAG